jgi:fatty-acyl-CoA synthase
MLGTMMQFPLTLTDILERTERLFGAVEIGLHLPDKSVHRSDFGDVCRRAGELTEIIQHTGWSGASPPRPPPD